MTRQLMLIAVLLSTGACAAFLDLDVKRLDEAGGAAGEASAGEAGATAGGGGKAGDGSSQDDGGAAGTAGQAAGAAGEEPLGGSAGATTGGSSAGDGGSAGEGQGGAGAGGAATGASSAGSQSAAAQGGGPAGGAGSGGDSPGGQGGSIETGGVAGVSGQFPGGGTAGTAMTTAGTAGHAGTPESCSVGTGRCQDNRPQACTVHGTWENKDDCAADAPMCNAGDCVLPPSCRADEVCNDEGADASCCTSVVVPGGTFPMGRGTEHCTDCVDGCPPELYGLNCPVTSGAVPDPETPEHDATVASFRLDKYEVTVGRFDRFVDAYDRAEVVALLEAGRGTHPSVPQSAWDQDWNDELPVDRLALGDSVNCHPAWANWGSTLETRARLPMNCVSWFEAFAFCAWDGGRLPTEAEWERAATADRNWLYPWGATSPTASHANAMVGAASHEIEVGSTPLGNGWWGHSDLAGSVGEWVLDWYSDTAYGELACEGCVNLTPGTDRVARGSDGWRSSQTALRSTYRSNPRAPQSGDPYVGFRCAREP